MGNLVSEQLSPEIIAKIESLDTDYEEHSIVNYITTSKQKEDFFFNFIINAVTQSQEFNKFCNIKSEAYKKSFPNRNCYLFPMERKTEYELDIHDENIVLSRRIFENKKGYEKEEIICLKSLYKEIAKYNFLNKENSLKFPNFWRISETLKFLQASKFDNKVAIENLKNHLDFRVNYFPIKLSNKAIEILVKTGFLYVHGRDRFCRPTIVCRAHGYISNLNKYSYDEFLSAVVFFMEYLINFLMVPGQIECWNIINDLNGVSIFSLPKDFHKFLKFLQVNYRCRLNISYVFGMNTVFEYLWSIIKTFLDKNVEKKIVFINQNNREKILDLILPEQIEKRYGGTCSNIFNDDGNLEDENFQLFPPIMPEKENLNEEDKKKLWNEMQYEEMVKEGRITDIAPFINFDKKGNEDNL
jgi:hypothetical protein